VYRCQEEGGIFGALWDMCEYGHMGLDVDIRSIPVRQEIIEICELLNINPYELESMGCLLMTADNDCDIINILNSHDIKASVIGHLTKGNQRILRNRDEERFLDIPKQDELYRGSKQ
jgi:hydrogenase expression/formation protein HypE